jgi:hypothetical protein
MPEWIVRLVGEEWNLRFLASALRSGDSRVTEEDGEFHLRSSRFAALASAGEVKAVADELLEQASLVAPARFDGYGGVLINRIIRLEQDKSRQVTDFLYCKVTCRVIPSAADIASIEEPRDLNRDMSLLQRRPLLLKALRHVRDEPGWPGYWKAVEALGEQVGGLHRIPELGWASEGEVDRFRKTAQHYRHHRVPAPPNPMTETEGRGFVLRLLQRCLDWERSRRSRRPRSW